MRKMWKKALASILTLAMTASSFSGFAAQVQAADTGKVTAEVKDDSVVIGNGYISREFSIADEQLSTVKITNKRTDGGDTVFTPAEGSEEFIIKLANQPKTYGALDRSGWTATTNSYQNATGAADGNASNLIDGNTGSIWHTNYGGGVGPTTYADGYYVLFDLGGSQNFRAFSYTPRTEGATVNGNIKGYELYASTSEDTLAADDEGWTLISSGDFTYDGTNTIFVNFEAQQTATQLKFVPTSANNGANFAGGAEFNLHEDVVVVEEESTEVKMFKASDLTVDKVEVTDTTATINKVEKTGKKITVTFKPYTYDGTKFSITENIVMYDGDHYMRKFMEIEIPEDRWTEMAIDYIDLESMNVAGVAADAQWTIPTDAGGIVQMETFKANLGQPIYIDGMFFGSEFPETDTQIVDETGYIRYYTGKTFDRFSKDNQLTTDGKYVTWQTVAGASRSAIDLQVIQADFFEYIYDIATPSDFRIQYNSWFDNMMLISDETIRTSFIEMDRELNEVEVRPLDSYVVDDGWINYNDTYEVDVARAGTGLNTEGFWAFNSKFPNGLTTSSDLVHKFGSNFGVWVGPRGGYNFYGHLANIIEKAGNGSKAGGSIDVADSTYHAKLTEMFVEWQKEYGVNYWKWDGFADQAQYNAFAATDAVPGYSNDHMTGGYHHMYHVTDLWEGWIDIFEAVRTSEEADGINKLWLSLTCYTNPSPWFLQWANSVWIQCIHDQSDAGSSSSKMDRQLTYRDAVYYDFINNHQFQFPLANIYNHDPVYGVEGTGMNKNTATDEQFQNYLYAQSARGTAFWELYFSDEIMTGDKYEVTSEFLAWAEENHNMLKNAKMFGGDPMSTVRLGSVSNSGTTDAYGFAGFDGNDGIITIRNSAQTAKEISFTFDRTLGVPEDAGTFVYHLEHTYNLTEGTATTGTFEYGKEYTFTLQADEVRMFRVSKEGDTTAPEFIRAFSDGDKVVTVKFNEKVTGADFTVSGAEIESVTQSADDVTYYITLTEALADNAVVEIAATDVKDMAGNACTDTISFVHNTGNVVANGTAAAADSLKGNNGFTVAATVVTATEGTVVAQDEAYALGINADKKATFTVNGATAVSDVEVVDGATIVGVKENNGILKLYVDGTLAGSAYKAENRFFEVAQADIVVANASKSIVLDTAYGYDRVPYVYTDGEEAVEESLQITEGLSATTTGGVDEAESDIENIFDGDPKTYWNSNAVTAIEAGNPNAVVDLGQVYKINKVEYSPRYFDGPQNYWCCTGNIKKLVVEISADGEMWTTVTPEGGLDLSDKIAKTADLSFFPVAVEFEAAEAKYVRFSGTESYHWQEGSENTSITIGDVAIYKAPAPKPVEINPEILAKNATANSEQLPAWDNDGGAAWAFDDEPHWWHSRYDFWDQKGDHEVGSVFGDGKPSESNPIWIQTGFDGVYNVDHITYTGRDGGMGIINNYTVSVAVMADPAEAPTDDDFTVVKTGNLEATTEEQTIQLDEAVAATHVRITITSVHAGTGDGHVSAQNISIFGYAGETPEFEPANKTKLQSLVDGAVKDGSDYTEASWAVFAAALEEAKTVLDNEKATQAKVDAAYNKLFAAALQLEKKPVEPPVDEVNKAALNAAIADAESKVEAEYTADSWAALAIELEEAKIVRDNADATQDEVDIATAELNAAIEALVEAEPPAPEVPEVPTLEGVTRLAGAGRIDTGLAVADTLKTTLGVEKFDTVIIATSKTFADALPGSYLAYVEKAPILLISDARMDDVVDYVKANLKDGGKVYILGGEAAVSPALEGKLEGYEVDRLAGAGRYETNLMILDRAKAAGGEIIVATGTNFADSLSASAAKLPILMVKDALNDAQKAFLETAKAEKFYIVGGEKAVSADVAAELEAYAAVERVAGENRRETSIEVAKKFFEKPEVAVVASASNFPDGLCGGPLAAALDAPLVLTVDNKTAEAVAYASELGIDAGYVLGGDGALADETVITVFALESAEAIK